WVDTDRDGIQDPGEPGIPGVTLTLTGPDGEPVTDVFGNPVEPVITDGDGFYDFPNLPALPAGQSYTVTIDPTSPALAPYIPTTPGQGDPDEDSSTGSATSGDLVNDGDRDDTLDFGFVLPSVSVGNFVWVDTDRDGIQDPGEPGIPGVVLILTGPDGEPVTDVFGNPVGPATTDANGRYNFPNLPGGVAYTVTIDPVASAGALAPYIPTTPGAGNNPAVDSSTGSATSVVLPNDGDRDSTLDFGFVLPSVSVGDYVWLDTDRDGVQDGNEPGIGGVQLTLTGPGGQPVTDVFGNPVPPVRTGPDGSYLFANLPALPPGQHYTVTVTSPPTDQVRIEGAAAPIAFGTIAPTTPNAGGNPARDSSTGSATSGNLTVNGAHDPTLDFGFVVSSVSVGGNLWEDADGDGTIDPGEPPIGGVLLELTGPDGEPVTDVFGNPVPPVRTDPDGRYDFANLPVLPPGSSYTVSIVRTDPQTTSALNGMNLTTTSWQLPADGLTDHGDVADGLDFGFRPPVAPQPPAPTTTTPPPLAPGLPATGGDIAQTLSFTMLLLMLGTGLTVLARQRRRVT
ncbi:MAG TPA: SdrD B-like domain-containing protein, partial [Ilumatobacter sp.]|nr:SdrD B-like domain-containing protein [Ilumatobacter sp.]